MSRDTVVFASYNTLDLFADSSAAGRERYGLVTEVIAGLGCDVLAVQEIRAARPKTAVSRLRELADDVGMACTVPGARGAPGRVALATGSRGYHCGIMWRPGIEPVPGSLREAGAGRFWHGAAWLTLDVGVRVRHAVFHATPFGRGLRAQENELLVAMLSAGPDGGLPLLIGADWNGESADRIRDEVTGALVLYEPGDPFAATPWFDELVHQCEWDFDERGSRRHWADRRAGDVLQHAGLLDAAAVLRAPWQPTTGHFAGDPYGDRGIRRRIDAIRVNRQMLPALRRYCATDTERAQLASDHLPVSLEYAPAGIEQT